MKRIISIILVLALVLGTVSYAVAAPKDVRGTEYEESVERLLGLGILKGYPDGSFKPENTITRAEFSVVAVKLLGLANAAKYAMGPTGFSDVPADHWASGYVNIAVNKGVIKGYPDGTFNPDNPVSYAEAVTILVRALGYGPATDEEGAWPANYITKATELGITEGINFYGYAPAKRGDVALMADNSLDIDLMVREGYGDEATYKVHKGESLLSEKLNCYTAKVVVLANKLVDNDLDEDEIRIEPEDIFGDDDRETILTMADGLEFDWAAHIGEELKLWFNEDDEVFNVETSSTVVNTRVLADVSDGDKYVLVEDPKDRDDEKKYYFTGKDDIDGKVYINLEEGYDDEDIEEGMDVKLVLNDDDEVIYVIVTEWTVRIVEDVDVDDEEIEIEGADLKLEGHEYDVDLEDIEEDDVIYYYYKDTGKDSEDDEDILRYFIVVVNDRVSGELEELGTDCLTVDGEDIDFGELAGTYNSREKLEEILGKEVTVLLDKCGDAYKVILDEDEEEPDNYALVTDLAVETDRYGNKTAYLKLLTAGGDTIEYEVAEDAVVRKGSIKVDMDKDGSSITEYGKNTADDADDAVEFDDGTHSLIIHENDKSNVADAVYAGKNFVIRYEMNSRGELDIIEIVKYTDASNVAVDEEDGTIGNETVERDTVFFDAVGEEVIEFNDFKDNGVYDIVKVTEGTFEDLKLVVYYGGAALSEETEYAVYISYKTVVDGYKVKLLVNGGQSWYFASDDDLKDEPDQDKGDLIEVEFDDGDIISLKDASITGEGLVVEEIDYDNLRMAVYEKGKGTFTIKANSDTVVYDVSDIDNIEEVEFGDIDDEMTVDYIENGDKPGYARVIVIK